MSRMAELKRFEYDRAFGTAERKNQNYRESDGSRRFSVKVGVLDVTAEEREVDGVSSSCCCESDRKASDTGLASHCRERI